MKKIALILLFMAFHLISNGCLAQTSPTNKPKIIVGLMVDQMRWDYLYKYQERCIPIMSCKHPSLISLQRETIVSLCIHHTYIRERCDRPPLKGDRGGCNKAVIIENLLSNLCVIGSVTSINQYITRHFSRHRDAHVVQYSRRNITELTRPERTLVII